MILLEPAWLLLLLLLPAVFFLPRSGFGWTATLRALTFLLIVVALARPVRLAEDTRETRVLVVDRSASLDAESQLAIETLAESLAERLRDQGPFERIDLTDSRYGAALARAAAAIPAGRAGSITLLGDGAATDDTWRETTQDLVARGLPVHVVPVTNRVDPRIVGLAARFTGTGGARVGAPLLVEAEILDAPEDFALLLSTDGGTRSLARAEFHAWPEAGWPFRARLEFEPDASLAGLAKLQARIVPLGDPALEARFSPEDRLANNTFEVTLPIEGPLQVLYLGARVAAGATEFGALLGPGFQLEVVAPESLLGESGAARLAAADALILDDMPAVALGDEPAAAIGRAVRAGGLGLFATGGAGAFGPGGWHDTAIEQLLPVELVQKEEKRDPSTTLVVIIDTSGSMGGNRVQLAKEVSRLAMRRLLPHDKVGIVEFYGAKRWAAPIQPASNAIEIERALNRLSAGGGTVILPAIEEAFYGLKNVHTRYKHVLILTDGGVETGAFEPLLRAMAEDGVNTSTVLIGSDAHSEFLVTLANWGKGRFYSVPNRFNLPEILLKQPTTAKLPAWRPGPHQVLARGGPKWWGPFDELATAGLADLDGYVETRLKPGAAALVETATEAHPILASWAFGLGRVTAFTSEPAGEGTDNWREEEFFGPLLARALERTARSEDAYELSLTRRGARLELLVESAAPEADFRGWSVRAADGRELPLTQVAPRRAAAQLLDQSALPELVLSTPSGERRLIAPPALAPELQVPSARWIDFDVLAAATAGTRTPLADLRSETDLAAFDAPVAGGLEAERERALWPVFLLAAILSYLLEVLLRRLDRASSAVVRADPTAPMTPAPR